MMAEVGRRSRYTRSAKRRSDAVTFLANISLDGSFSATEASPASISRAEGKKKHEEGTGAERRHHHDQLQQVQQQASDSTLAVTGGVTEVDGASLSEIALAPSPFPAPVPSQSQSQSPGTGTGTTPGPVPSAGPVELACSTGTPRARRPAASRSSSGSTALGLGLGVSTGSLRVKSISVDRGSPQFPSKFDLGSRPRAQTQIVSSTSADLAKYRPRSGVAAEPATLEGLVHKQQQQQHHHHHHHHHQPHQHQHHHHRHPHATAHGPQVLGAGNSGSSSSSNVGEPTAANPLGPPLERASGGGKVLPVQTLPQHQSRKPSRVLLVSARKAPISLYSILPYSRRSQHGLLRNDSEITNPGRTRKTSGTKGTGSETHLSSLAGVDLGDGVKEISYRHLLIPTKDQLVYRRQHSLDVLSSPHSPSIRKTSSHPLSMQWDRGDLDLSAYDHTSSLVPYDPMELDDPGLHAGKHSKVMTFTSYMVSILDYTKPSELKKDINQKFKDKFPHIDLTLSKLRSIKRDMRKIVVEMGSMDLLTLAHAYVYFEKLVLYGKINKENRKLCAAACLTLAAKLNDTKGAELQNLIKEIEDTFRESRKDFLQLEFPILVALEFSLHLPETVVMPHYRRIAQFT